MNLRRPILSGILCVLALATSLQARNVFVLPGAASPSQVISVFAADPLTFANSVQGSPGSFIALSHPLGNRFFVIANSPTGTVSVLDGATFAVIQRIDLLSNGTAGVITPDGRRLLVTAGSLYIFDITGTSLSLPSPIAVTAGTAPIDVAVSLDSSRAFVLSASDQRLTAVDLNSNSVVGTLPIPGQSTGVAVAPNGLVYVSTVNRFYEIDGRTVTFTRPDGIALNATPGKPAFSADGRYALLPNRTPLAGNSAAILIDLLNKTVAGILQYSGFTLDTLVAAGNDRVYAVSSQTQTLYDITLSPLNISPATFGTIGIIGNVVSAASSNELPKPRYLYVVTTSVVYRIDLNTSDLSGQAGLTAAGGRAVYTAPVSTNAPTGFLQYNNNQTLGLNATSLPLIVRATDAGGRPAANAPVAWSTTGAGLVIQSSMAATNAEGFALATVVTPGTGGTYTVNAAIGPGGALVASFTINVTGGGVPGVTGGIAKVSGDGQVVREFSPTPEPLVVVVRDLNGNPVPSASVDFALTQGLGTLNPGSIGIVSGTTSTGFTMLTDQNGQASATFVGTLVSPGFSFQQATVTASSGGASVTFTVTTVLTSLPGGMLAPDPTVVLIKPASTDVRIEGQAGQTLPGAIQVQVAAAAGAQAGTPLPNVGLRVTTGNDPELGPTAECVGGTALTDASGIATCDLRLGGRIGEAQLTIITGGFNTRTVLLNVTPGPPAAVRIVQGNNQSGNAGQTLPLALVAEITDAGGNLLSGVAVTWEAAGGITLSNVISTADRSGRVSALATLGSTPGTHVVRVRAGDVVGSFSLTVNVTISQIQKVSGDNQVGFTNQSFPQPLVVQVNDNQGRPLGGVTVNFAVLSGSATVSAASATTNSSGQASTTVRAGGAAGPIVIRAAAGDQVTTFSLSSRLPGPQIVATGFVNAASFQPGVVPGSIATIRGAGLATGLQGCVEAGSITGPLPTTLANVTVMFGAHLAPIYSVCNIGGQEQVSVQVPWELGPGQVPVQVTVGGGSTIVSGVQVLQAQPGIFETAYEGRLYAVVARPNGTWVSPTNRARPGEELRLYVTGLGPVLPVSGTNQPGVPGQRVYLPVIVGVNNAGVRVISAEYAENLIGVYVVTFELPADAPPGLEVPLNMSVQTQDGQMVFSNGTRLAIQ